MSEKTFKWVPDKRLRPFGLTQRDVEVLKLINDTFPGSRRVSVKDLRK